MLNNDPNLQPKPPKISSENTNGHFLHNFAHFCIFLHFQVEFSIAQKVISFVSSLAHLRINCSRKLMIVRTMVEEVGCFLMGICI